MPDEPMTIVERLRNPRWTGEPGTPNSLDVDGTIKDMADAADLLESLSAQGKKSE